MTKKKYKLVYRLYRVNRRTKVHRYKREKGSRRVKRVYYVRHRVRIPVRRVVPVKTKTIVRHIERTVLKPVRRSVRGRPGYKRVYGEQLRTISVRKKVRVPVRRTIPVKKKKAVKKLVPSKKIWSTRSEMLYRSERRYRHLYAKNRPYFNYIHGPTKFNSISKKLPSSSDRFDFVWVYFIAKFSEVTDMRYTKFYLKKKYSFEQVKNLIPKLIKTIQARMDQAKADFTFMELSAWSASTLDEIRHGTRYAKHRR